jgi:hypothetical protein
VQYAIITKVIFQKTTAFRLKKESSRYSTAFRDLLFHDLQHFHRACLHANSAGDALGGSTLCGRNHYLHGAYFHTLAAGSAELLVDHVHAGLGILGNSAGLTSSGALAALDAGHGLGTAILGNNTDTRKIFIKCLMERGRTGADTFQTGHAGHVLFYSELLHQKRILLFYIFL